jgi:3-oxoadipate enol-lactonase
MPATTLGNIQLHYSVSGSGPDVVLLHGWLSSLRMWDATAAALAAAGRRCWALDLPGFGQSPAPVDGCYSIEAYAALVAAFCAGQGIQRAAVVGHSLGSAIALTLALDQPELVERVVTVSAVPRGRVGPPVGLVSRLRLGRVLAPAARRAWPALSWAESLAAPHLPRRLARRAHDMARADAGAVMAALRALLHYDLSARLPELQRPVLLVHGARDRIVPPAESQFAAARIPGARLVLLPAAHSPVEEQPAEFQRVLLGFLGSGSSYG